MSRSIDWLNCKTLPLSFVSLFFADASKSVFIIIMYQVHFNSKCKFYFQFELILVVNETRVLNTYHLTIHTYMKRYSYDFRLFKTMKCANCISITTHSIESMGFCVCNTHTTSISI